MSESSPTAPLIIGRYAFHGEIASGGMATVHFARLLGPGKFSRIVAAKRLLPHLVSDPVFTSMLLDEASIAARVRHPNVVSTLDVISTGQELVVVMEYVHGEALSRLMRTASDLGERVPPPIAGTIVVDALHGLHAAHQAKDEAGHLLGLVHRDVSPQNLLVGADGVTQIADFGIALASGRTQETRNGTVKGKLSYMAPEQIERGPLTPATDVFALSIILWELLTGERLFGGANDGEIVHRVLSGDVPAPSALVPDLPPGYDRILARGLSRDPAQRYASARDMALELEQSTPLVRASEVGAWVTRMASDTLTRRSLRIAKIESGQATPGADSPDTKLVPRTALQPEIAGTGSRVSWARSEAARKPGGLHVLAIALLAAGSAAAALWYLPRSNPVAPTLPSRARPAPSSPPPVEVSSAPPPLAESVVTSAAAAAPPATSAPPAAESRLKRAVPPVRARPRPSADCDPPYSLDAAGRRLFKLECM